MDEVALLKDRSYNDKMANGIQQEPDAPGESADEALKYRRGSRREGGSREGARGEKAFALLIITRISERIISTKRQGKGR